MHHVVVDLAFGDSGKGTTTEALCVRHEIDTVVRYNGGAQAAHHVVHLERDGSMKEHRFAQFGCGTLHDVRTHLSRFVMVDPIRLRNEAEVLRFECNIQRPFELISIDNRCLITTPFHALANKMRETERGDTAHGSCGVGIGETASLAQRYPSQAITWGDLQFTSKLREMLAWQREWLFDEFGTLPFKWQRFIGVPSVKELVEQYQEIHRLIDNVDRDFLPDLLGGRSASRFGCVFEGAQGVLLDEWYGFHPYTTWSTCTPENAVTLLEEANVPREEYEILGVMRSFTTRHGAGPFPTQDPTVDERCPELHNGTGVYQGAFRAGQLDLVALRYARDVVQQHGGLDGLVVTHLDARPSPVDAATRVCTAYALPDGKIHPLRAPRRQDREDLAAREKVTQQLFTVTPVYTQVDYVNSAPWRELVVERLEAPIVGGSFGTTVRSKEWY